MRTLRAWINTGIAAIAFAVTAHSLMALIPGLIPPLTASVKAILLAVGIDAVSFFVTTMAIFVAIAYFCTLLIALFSKRTGVDLSVEMGPIAFFVWFAIIDVAMIVIFDSFSNAISKFASAYVSTLHLIDQHIGLELFSLLVLFLPCLAVVRIARPERFDDIAFAHKLTIAIYKSFISFAVFVGVFGLIKGALVPVLPGLVSFVTSPIGIVFIFIVLFVWEFLVEIPAEVSASAAKTSILRD